MDGRTTSRNKARLLVLAVFLIGTAAGALSMNLYLKAGAPERGRRSPGEALNATSERLSLTTDQRERVGAILKETFSQYDLIKQDAEPCFQQVKPRFDAVRQAGRDKIRALLTEEQLPKFEQMVREQDAERESRENRDRDRKKSGK